MNQVSYIPDLPLSPEQDFRLLKEKALDFVRTHSEGEWSNLNSSDPGITIMDQVCFAMSELGYCTNFSLPDIITGSDDKIRIEDQFYWPEQILTSAPVTAEDYVRYLTDEVEDVINAVIIPDASQSRRIYQTYLLTDDVVRDEKVLDDICTASFHALNKCRNLGEMFLKPVVLEKIKIAVIGLLTVDTTEGLALRLVQLQRSLNDHIFPAIGTNGFDELYNEQVRTEDILNGPRCKNGWSTGATTKKDIITVDELNFLLEGPGGEITALKMEGDDKSYTSISVKNNQVIFVDVSRSIEQGLLVIESKHALIAAPAILEQLKQISTISAPGIHPAALNNKLREVPASRFRDISSYYSIQHTFPEIYAAGADAVTSNASDNEVARSRQLKGYLTLFDQVMANQFAQLSHVEKLFSFSNSSVAARTDKKYFDIRSGHMNGIYPVPYKTFSPTYFYQSLYQVPHIKPLLKDHDVFRLATISTTREEQEQKSWEAYQLDPYNSYIYGLLGCVDDEAVNLDRRNKLLDHLLARHGESPLFIDTVIDGTEYTGDSAKDKVIVKSLLLQNLKTLSYYRAKAMNVFAADPVNGSLLPGHRPDQLPRDGDDIESYNRITNKDLINHCQVELRLNLLLGLKTQYDHYILENPTKEYEIKLCEWMMDQRRGSIMIETSLLNYFIADENKSPLDEELLVFFPSFIPHFMTKGFRARLDHFLQYSLPIGITYKVYFIDAGKLLQLIPRFANWINSTRYHANAKSDTVNNSSKQLLDLINIINA